MTEQASNSVNTGTQSTFSFSIINVLALIGFCSVYFALFQPASENSPIESNPIGWPFYLNGNPIGLAVASVLTIAILSFIIFPRSGFKTYLER